MKLLQKYKILIIICIIITTNAVNTTIGLKNEQENNAINSKRIIIDSSQQSDPYDAELPLWKLGDKWIYKIELDGESDGNLGHSALAAWLDLHKERWRRAVVGLLAAVGLCIQVLLMSINWAYTYHAMQYPAYRPRFSFLFVPDVSPLAAYLRQFLAGQNIDLWIVTLWRGHRGFPGQPEAVIALLVIWAALFGAAIFLFVRHLRTRM